MRMYSLPLRGEPRVFLGDVVPHKAVLVAPLLQYHGYMVAIPFPFNTLSRSITSAGKQLRQR